MSHIIHNGTHAPAKNGMVISQNTTNPKAYQTVAYCHPDSPTTYFSATAGSAYYDEKFKLWMHAGLVTSVKGKTIPDKPDNLVSSLYLLLWMLLTSLGLGNLVCRI
jgi:hypothetical protein